jgi:hypothetical protein
MARCEECVHYEVCLKFADVRIILCGGKANERCKLFKPTADVAPKAEVAREIFEEIEKHLFVIAPIEEFDGWARIQLADIMRLKKKYTQPEPPKGD